MKLLLIPCALWCFEAHAQLNSGLVGYWKLNGDLLDASGNGLDATTNLPITLAANRSGGNGCALFGTDFDVNTPTAPGFAHDPNGAFTFSIWLRRATDFLGFNMRGAIWPWVPQQWEFSINNTDGLVFGNANQPQLLHAGTGMVMPDNDWHHYVGIYKDHDWSLFYDGQVLLQDTLTTEDVGTGSGNILTNTVNGDLDDFRYYDRALTAQEVDSLFHEASDCMTSDIDEAADVELSLFPNPTTDMLLVRMEGHGAPRTSVSVFDARGRLVAEQAMKGDRASVDMRAMAPGIYEVRLVMGDAMRTARVVRE